MANCKNQATRQQENKVLGMKLGILICDQVQEKLQPRFGDYPMMFNDLFQRTNETVDVCYYSAINHELPTDIDECDAYITSGSRWGVNDDKLWIRELEEFIRKLYLAEKKFVGICFGHQLIAKSLGGQVEKSTKGWGIGIAFSEIIEKQSWMKSKGNTLALVVSHQDQITKLPPHSQVLLSNEFCPYSMIKVGANFLGLQGHPEFSRQYSKALMNSRRDRIGAAAIDNAISTLVNEADDVLATQWIIAFIKQSA